MRDCWSTNAPCSGTQFARRGVAAPGRGRRASRERRCGRFRCRTGSTRAQLHLFDMQEKRRKMDDLLQRKPLLRRRTVILPAGLPPRPDFTDPAEDGRDAFFDM